jgi:hypothetical protein
MKATVSKYLIAVTLYFVAFTMPAWAFEWSTYTNGLYGYEICYPADLLKPGGESDNGDGNTFTSESGATLKVWGSYNAAGESLESLTADIVPDLKGYSANVSYRRRTDAFSVVSGRNGNMIFYVKFVLDKDGYRAIQVTFPVSESKIYDPMLARMPACFQAAPEQ